MSPPSDIAVDELLAEHAATNPLVRFALEQREPRDLTSQGEGRTGDAPRVTRTAARVARHPLGVAIVTAVAFAAIYLGVLVAWESPLFSGGHLIAGPVLITAGGVLLARLATVQLRRNR